MIIEPFEKVMFAEHMAGAQEVVILLPKKNYKTTALAAIALWHISEVEDAECVIGASSRDQASILFNQACGLVRRSGLEQFSIKTGYREIRCGGGRLRVLAADAATADGVIPTLALVDELHRHPSGELYGVFRDGLEARGGQMITISTAGFNSASPLGILRAKAYALPSFTRRNYHNHAVSADRAFAFHEWCLTDTDDLSDMRLVKKVNPARHHTLASLRRRYESPSMTPARWARFACGIFPENEMPWIEMPAWEACKADIGGVAEGEEVFVSVRVGAGAGIALVAPRGDERVAVKVQIMEPPTEGRLPFKAVEFALRRVAEQYQVISIGYDPDQFRPSAEVLMELGLPMEEQPQRVTRLSVATSALYRLISAGLLSHDGDPALRAQVRAGKAKETTQGWHLEPTAETNGLIALAMASLEATKASGTTPEVIVL